LEGLELKGFVLLGSTVQESFDSSLLKSVSDVGTELLGLELGNLVEKRDLEHTGDSLFPAGLVQGSSSVDNKVSVALSCEIVGLSVVLLDQSLEVL